MKGDLRGRARQMAMLDPHLSRWPIVPHLSGFLLLDPEGDRVSYHRTMSGALRKRRAMTHPTTWQNGHAADCRSAEPGSTPGVVSIPRRRVA